MSSGKKNYFRFSVFTRKDEKIVSLIENFGKEAFFHYFTLVSMCAAKALEDGLAGDDEFVFHVRSVCDELMVTRRKLGDHMVAIQSSLLGHIVVTENKVKLRFPNLPKYLGRYESKLPSNYTKERKEKERKEKEMKEKKMKEAVFEKNENLGNCDDEHKVKNIFTNLIKNCYSLAYEKKYKIKPTWTIKENSLAEKLIQLVGQEEANKLAEFYPSFLDSWHSEQKHPFSLLVAKIDQIRIAMNINFTDTIINPYTLERKKLKESKQGIETEFSKDDL